MKIKTKLIIGLSILMITFFSTMTVNLHYESQIENVANYHNFMSIPALTILEKISLNFSNMHGELFEYVARDYDPDDQVEYLQYYENLNSLIADYDTLTWETNLHGEFFASEMMRNQMQDYTQQIENIKEKYHKNALSIFSNNDLEHQQIQLIFDDMHVEHNSLLEIIEEAKAMELRGQLNEQNKIDLIKTDHEVFFNFSLVISTVTAFLISIWIIHSVETPIKKIKLAASRISRGQFDSHLETQGNDEFSGLYRDINKMSHELNNQTNQIKKQERLAAIGELSARIAHDLRNPLSSIKLSTDLIKNEIPSQMQESLQEKFRIIDRSIDRMSYQVENVLDFLREKSLKLSSCNISDIVKHSFVALSVPKTVKIHFELSNGNIVCDKEKVETMMTNLLVNAIQAISENGEITVKTRTEQDSAIIEVQDSGPGVPQELQEKIFEPLFTTKQTGTGLGLASCKKIVESHKGNISYKDNPSTFIVKLPRLANPLVRDK